MTWEPWSRIDDRGLARFVTSEAKRWLALDVSRFDVGEDRRQIVEAIYNALVEKNIRYALEDYHPSEALQPIRPPAEILGAPYEGTCLDLAVLFCGLCLGNELLPILIVLEDHALAGVSLVHGLRDWDGYRSERALFEKGPLTDPEPLRRLIDQGSYLAVECTGFAHSEKFGRTLKNPPYPESAQRTNGVLSFDRAITAGREQLDYPARSFQFALDIAVAHHAWRLTPHPLPQPPPAAEPGSVLPLEQQGIPQSGKFFGRETHMTQLREALTDDSNSLVVLVGIGGVGKTALALQAARMVEGNLFEAVVWTTSKDQPLTLVTLLDAIARVLHFPYIIQLEPHRKKEAILAELSNKRCLLLVDNFETVKDNEVIRFLKSLPAPTKALITSRERAFDDHAEVVLLEGLDKKSARELMKDGADRIRLNLRGISLKKLDKLYEATGGAPKAIELAIPLIKELLSFDRVLQKLSDAKGEIFEFMFEQLWQLLGDAEQLLLKSLPIFSAQASRAALASVSDLSMEDFDSGLQRLRQLCLLDANEDDLDNEYKPRFSLHPLTRAFARTHLRQTPGLEAELCEHLASYFSDYIKCFGGGVEQEQWERFDRLEEERENLLPTLDWCYTQQRKDLLLPLLRGMSRYLFVYGHWQRRVEQCWQAIELLTGVKEPQRLPSPDAVIDVETKRHLAWLLRDIGRVYTNQDEHRASHAVLTRALAFAQSAEDVPEVAFVQFHLGELAFRLGDDAQAEQHWKESLRLNQQIDQQVHVIGVTYWLGVLSYSRGELRQAEQLLEENLHLCEARNWERLEAYHLNYMGDIALKQSRYDDARRYYNRGYAIVKKRDTRRRAFLELSLAHLEEATCDLKRALRWAEEAEQHFNFLGMNREKLEAATLAAKLKTATANADV